MDSDKYEMGLSYGRERVRRPSYSDVAQLGSRHQTFEMSTRIGNFLSESGLIRRISSRDNAELSGRNT